MFSDLVENICLHSTPPVYKLAAYLVAHHISWAMVLQHQIMKNTSKLEIGSLLEILERIEMVATIDERTLESIRKSYLNDFNELLLGDDKFWLRKECRKWIEKIVYQLGRFILVLC
jgi:hypothetical protein